MRLLLSFALVAPLLMLLATPLPADENVGKLQTLEGELRIHPKYLYKYYVAFNGQTCALYSSTHKREDNGLAALKPGAQVRVRGVLGTEFHRSTATKDNPSPFSSAWVLYMDVESIELLGNPKLRQHEVAPVRVGMTFQEVVNARGNHYRLFTGARSGSVVLVYDDISVDVFDYAPDSVLKGRVQHIQKTDLEAMALYLKGIPYADAQRDAPEVRNGSGQRRQPTISETK